LTTRATTNAMHIIAKPLLNRSR